jgi:hypothetical protein
MEGADNMSKVILELTPEQARLAAVIIGNTSLRDLIALGHVQSAEWDGLQQALADIEAALDAAQPGVFLSDEDGADVVQLLTDPVYPSDIESEDKAIGICAKIQKQLKANNDDASDDSTYPVDMSESQPGFDAREATSNES